MKNQIKRADTAFDLSKIIQQASKDVEFNPGEIPALSMNEASQMVRILSDNFLNGVTSDLRHISCVCKNVDKRPIAIGILKEVFKDVNRMFFSHSTKMMKRITK
jgi:hypothetical protein